MFKKIATIAWKDTLIRFSGRSELLFFLVLPIVFITLLSGGIGGDGDTAGARISLLVVDEDGTAAAADLIAALETAAAVDTHVLAREEAEAAAAAPALLVIPAGFGEQLAQGETAALELRQSTNDGDADVVRRTVLAAANNVGRPWLAARYSLAAAERARPFAGSAAADAYLETGVALAQETLTAAPRRLVVTQPEASLVGTGFDQAAHQSAGQLITWVFIPLLGTAGLFAYERRKGTLRRLITTPTGKATFLLGTIGGQFAVALVQMALLVAFAMLVLGVSWGRSPAGLALVLVTFGLASVAFGTMLGTFIKTEGQASNVSILFGMAMALLGGCWFPLELFPPAVQTAVHALPTTWAMQGLTDLALRGQGLAAVLPEAAVLLGFAVLFFAVGVRRFRYE